MQANRARSVLIQQVQAFFTGNAIDAFIGPPTNELSMGNVVGLPETVIPVSFSPVSFGSPRQQPTSLGIYAPANQDSKARTPSPFLRCMVGLQNAALETYDSCYLCVVHGTKK